jgi:hypothetical protein
MANSFDGADTRIFNLLAWALLVSFGMIHTTFRVDGEMHTYLPVYVPQTKGRTDGYRRG